MIYLSYAVTRCNLNSLHTVGPGQPTRVYVEIYIVSISSINAESMVGIGQTKVLARGPSPSRLAASLLFQLLLPPYRSQPHTVCSLFLSWAHFSLCFGSFALAGFCSRFLIDPTLEGSAAALFGKRLQSPWTPSAEANQEALASRSIHY